MNKTNLPKNHRRYTDKYFLRANEILKRENINPMASMKVFARGHGRISGLEEAVEVLLNYSDLKDRNGEIWVTRNKEYATKEPLMIIKGPIQSYIELETMYLGVLSDAISSAAGFGRPEPEKIKLKFQRLKDIYQNIPITYFGARHYHWSLDNTIAKAALEGGAVQTSTDMGSSNINKEGVGTTPHVLTLMLAYKYGKDIATLKTAELFDKYMPIEIPRTTLVDTFNRELTDGLMVVRYFGNRHNLIRIDTCGENVGESCSLYNNKKERDPLYENGTGVTIDLAAKLRLNLIQNGFANYTDTILTSGFGDEEKAKAFVKANERFKGKFGYDLFTGVGIGEVSKSIFCTADIFEIENKPFSKVGREVYDVDYKNLEKVL